MLDNINIILFIFFVFLLFISWRKFWRKKGPPCCKLGILETLSKLNSGQLPHFILQCSHTLGPIFRLNIPEWNPFILVCDFRLAKKVLEGDESIGPIPLDKSFHYKAFKKMHYNTEGMFTKRTKGEGWEWARKGAAPSFSTINLNKKIAKLNELLYELQSILDKNASTGIPFDIATLMVHFTFDFITASMFDSNFHAMLGGNSTGSNIIKAIEISIKEYSLKQVYNPFRSLLFWLPEIKRANEALAVIRKFLENVLSQYRSSHTLEELKSDTSIMGHLLRSPYPTDKHRCVDMLEFIVAGFDTSGYTIAWTLIEVSKHPDVLQKIQLELDAVNPDRSTPFLPSHFSKLEYLSRVIQESMRLNPVAVFASIRKAEQDIPYEDFVIKKGSSLLLAQYCYFRRGIRDPDSFIPDRWKADDPEAATLQAIPSPFSSGIRNCIGQNLAKLEIMLVLSTLLRSYTFELVNKDELRSDYALTYKPVNALMRVSRREN